MKQPQNDPPPFSKSNNTLVSTLLVLIGLGILLLIAIVVFAFQGRFPSPAFLAPATQTQPFPTLFFPTSECGSPTLLIGSTGFKIQNVSLSPYGTVKIPADTNGIAKGGSEIESNRRTRKTAHFHQFD